MIWSLYICLFMLSIIISILTTPFARFRLSDPFRSVATIPRQYNPCSSSSVLKTDNTLHNIKVHPNWSVYVDVFDHPLILILIPQNLYKQNSAKGA